MVLPSHPSQGNILLQWAATRHAFSPSPAVAPRAVWSGFPALQPTRKVLDVPAYTNDKSKYLFNK